VNIVVAGSFGERAPHEEDRRGCEDQGDDMSRADPVNTHGCSADAI
jgi:hypothetical protein